MNMVREGQIQRVEKGAVRERVIFINQIFGVATEFELLKRVFLSFQGFCNIT